MTDIPKLLKARQFHSRLFAFGIIVLLLVSQPLMEAGSFMREAMLWIGYALVPIGAMGRVFCSVFIGGRKNDVVVRDGVFSVVRNPLYVFSFIATVGIGLQSGSWVMFALLTGVFVLYYPLVVAKEEAFLKHKFGEPYEKYMREVPRWFPNMELWQESEQLDAKPKFIRRTIGDALIFFLPMPCFAILNALHASGTLPVWLSLP
ncbi:MAG: methyltransferase family protein [Rickettsiales bacterium]